jgi:hypothetical protein
MVAMVDSYSPRPGRNLGHYLAIDVEKAGNDSTSIADALQRYLNVRPNRKPGGDPKDVASNDSFPTLTLDEALAWNDPLPYKFSVNGIVQRQAQSSFYGLGGSIMVRITGAGVTTIATPATEGAPALAVGPIPAGAYYPPEVAAQLAMRRLTDMFDTSHDYQPLPIGPNLTKGPTETLGAIATSLAAMKHDTGPRMSESVKTGINNFANLGIYSSSPRLYLTVLADRM